MDETADEVNRHALDCWCDSPEWADAEPFDCPGPRGSVRRYARGTGVNTIWPTNRAAGEIG